MTIKGTLAFLGVWTCFCAIADFVLVIEQNAWAMAFGVLAAAVGKFVESWIDGDMDEELGNE